MAENDPSLRGVLLGPSESARYERALALDLYLREIEELLLAGSIAEAKEKIAHIRTFTSWITKRPGR
jgi:hypothetical protein